MNRCTNVCENSVCVDGDDLPCDDGNPCTTDNCTNNEGEAECGSHDVKTNGSLCDDAPCFGDNAECWSGLCIPSDDTESRPCFDGNIATVDECSDLESGIQCQTTSKDQIAISCGNVSNLTYESFDTREYYTYGGSCPGTYSGFEAALALTLSANYNVTVAVENPSPSMNLQVLYLSDWTNRNSCSAQGVNSLNISLAASIQPYIFVLDSVEILPPNTVNVRVTCTQ